MRNEELMKKWAPILEHNALPAISDSHREAVTATLLENTEASIKEGSSLGNSGMLSETTNNTVDSAGAGGNYDPVLISLVRRAMPNLVAYDIVGVQPMTGPTGLIFAMKSKYATTDAGQTAGNEALLTKLTLLSLVVMLIIKLAVMLAILVTLMTNHQYLQAITTLIMH